MSVVAFPRPQRLAIADPGDVSAIETAISAVVGTICATGGNVALAGRDLLSTPVSARIALLTEMYDAGEVVFGFFDARCGDTFNVVMERLSLPPQGSVGWRAEIYTARPDGHELLGALSATDATTLGAALVRAAGVGFSEPLESPGKALARIVRR